MRRIRELTDRECREARPREKLYKMFDGRGLYLEVGPSGRKAWWLKFLVGKKDSRVSLGEYPSTSLARARILREEHRRRLREEGVTPSQHKRREALARQVAAANTFEAVAREWIEVRTVDWAPKTASTVTTRLEQNLFGDLGARPIAQISVAELRAALLKVEARGTLVLVKKLRQYADAVFEFGRGTDRCVDNPAQRLKRTLKTPQERHHPAILDPIRLGELLRDIDGYRGTAVVRSAFRLAPLVFVRPGELRQAEWKHIDLQEAVWRIPPGEMKKRNGYVIPLSLQALAILREIQPFSGRGRYVFPSIRGQDRPMSENTINAALRSLGYTKDEMTGHGFRTIACTFLNEEGTWNRDAIERQLSHTERDTVRDAYNRAEYINERRRMMQAWADCVDQLAQRRPKPDAANEVPPVQETADAA
ncbi:integrase [Solimonas fluminis]|uniref:Integrase n=1 Tax=Solimonas fluminis TaxID=2086571 RepID=A0A2S5TDL1_9GAMM|nr:integrase arm-type DNA-binding domain-containing protein [Solimonas fluminis]PPE73066.1 integrase [Solimonas fluminis]